jgi:DNA-binding GntR family transcriptional regulator
MIESGFEKIVPERRVEKVRSQIHAAIYSGTLKPGAVLRETELCQRLGVSQATVREALAKIEHLGLVVRTPHRRTEVKNLTRKELDERIAVRVSLESLACELALKNNWSEVDFEELALKAERILTPDPLADLAFHRYIWCRSGNVVLLQTLLQVSSCLFGFVNILRAAKLQDPQARLESHKRFIAALRTEKLDVIRGAVEEHLDTAYQTFRERNYPDFKSLAEQMSRSTLPRVEATELVSLSS